LKPFAPFLKFPGNGPALAFSPFSEGISKMIMLKIAAAIVTTAIAGGAFLTFAPDFSADFALVVVACFA